MAPYQSSTSNRNALRNTTSSASPTTAPQANLSANLKTLWPSPHKSNLQITEKGVERHPIMYPGGKTVASPKVSTSASQSDKTEVASDYPFSLQYLALQQRMQQANRLFHMLVNVLKAQHESAKAMIENLKA